MLKLSKTAGFQHTSQHKIVNYGRYQLLLSDEEFEAMKMIAYHLLNKGVASLDELTLFVSNNNIQESLLEKMISKKIIVEDRTEENMKYDKFMDRNLLYLDLFSENLHWIDQERTILLVGLGGIGNFLSFTLCNLGIKNYIFIDGDVVEETNLNRQFLFKKSDIGRNKVDVVQEQLEQRFGRLNITKFPEKFNAEILSKIDSKIDLIILSADDRYIVNPLNDFAVLNKIAMMNLGYLNDFAAIGPFYIPGYSACFNCATKAVGLDNEGDDIVKALYSNYQSPAFFVNNSVPSAMATMDIIHYFSGNYDKIKSANARWGIDLHDFASHFIPVAIDENCTCQNLN